MQYGGGPIVVSCHRETMGPGSGLVCPALSAGIFEMKTKLAGAGRDLADN